jgi:hypothetical protein
VVSLRGSEGLLLDLCGLITHNSVDNNQEFFLIPLLGKVKGETHDRCHLLPCARETSSGMKPWWWVSKLIRLKQHQGFNDGPAISDDGGRVRSVSSLNSILYELLEELYEKSSDIFPSSIKEKDDIYSSYGVYRSFRRSSDTRALNMGVSKDDIDLVNRWHQVEKAGGKRPVFEMRHHYAQYELLVDPFVRYTTAM